MGYFLTTISKIWETSLAAIGGHLTLSLGGILLLGLPASFWCGAYGYAIAAKSGLPLFAAGLIGLGLSALIGIIFAFFYVRLSNDSFAVVTLASMFAMDALLRSWDSLTGGVLGIAGVPRLGWGKTLGNLAILEMAVVFFALIVESILARSSFGRSLRALKENKTALVALGISAERVGQSAILIASVIT